MEKKVAVILSGCGFLDGTEIGEALLSLLAIQTQGMTHHCFALDRDQKKVTSHRTQKDVNETRNILDESGRIARCDVQPIDQLKGKDYDLLWMPGGYGSLVNHSDFTEKGVNCSLDAEINRVINEFYEHRKPIVALCISPLIVAKALEGKGVTITLGTKDEPFENLEKLGHKPKRCRADEYALDPKHHIYSAPAYMEDDATLVKIFFTANQIASHVS